MTLCKYCGTALITAEQEQFHKMFDRCPRCTDNWSRILIDCSEDRKVKDIYIPGERKIGFEIESNPTFSSAVNIFSSSLAHFKADGSLRGNNPVEFVSPLLSQSTYEEYCDKFFGMLDVSEWYSRQSAHVHIDTSDLNWYEFNLMAAKATSNWRLFAAMCPPNRCPIAADRNDGGPRMNTIIPVFRSKAEMLYYMYGRSDLRAKKHSNMSIMRSSKRCGDGEMRGAYPGGCLFRYDWLNLHGHFHKGATEWRIFASTKSAEKMKNWINFLIQFTEAVKYMKPAEYMKAPISAMITADIWYWVLNRIESLRNLHIRAGKIDKSKYTGRKDIPIIVEPFPKILSVEIPRIEKEDNEATATREYRHLIDWLTYYSRTIRPIRVDIRIPQAEEEPAVEARPDFIIDNNNQFTIRVPTGGERIVRWPCP